MILLDNVIKIFDLENVDQPEPSVQNESEIDIVQPGKIGTAFIDDDFVGEPIVADCAFKKAVAAASSRASRRHGLCAERPRSKRPSGWVKRCDH